MSKPTQKIEIGLDTTANNVGPYFRLDDPVRGVLDNSSYLLGGTIFFDVTSKVKSFSIRRGKSRQLDKYSAGIATVVFDNNNRDFDPEYAASPYYGQIIPRREVRITSGTAVQYFGSVDDWNLDYAPNSDNTAAAICADGFRTLAQQTIEPRTNTEQLSGDRAIAILDLAEINWPIENRSIDSGQQTLGADELTSQTNALSYLQLIEQSEPGRLFISKSGSLTFLDRGTGPSSSVITLADDGSGIPYQGMQVVYGSELLYNDVVLTTYAGATAIAGNTNSQQTYGVLTLSQSNLLMSTTTAAEELAAWYSKLYADPEFRFESVNVVMNDLTVDQQNEILDLELGDSVKIVFTPGNPAKAPAIEKYAEIIRLDHTVDSIKHTVSIGFATLDFAYLVLDDSVFGRIGTGVLGL